MILQKVKKPQKGELQKTTTIRKEGGKAIVMKEGVFTPNHNCINYRIKKSIVRGFLILEDSSISFLPNVPTECSNKILPKMLFLFERVSS